MRPKAASWHATTLRSSSMAAPGVRLSGKAMLTRFVDIKVWLGLGLVTSDGVAGPTSPPPPQLRCYMNFMAIFYKPPPSNLDQKTTTGVASITAGPLGEEPSGNSAIRSRRWCHPFESLSWQVGMSLRSCSWAPPKMEPKLRRAHAMVRRLSAGPREAQASRFMCRNC